MEVGYTEKCWFCKHSKVPAATAKEATSSPSSTVTTTPISLGGRIFRVSLLILSLALSLGLLGIPLLCCAAPRAWFFAAFCSCQRITSPSEQKKEETVQESHPETQPQSKIGFSQIFELNEAEQSISPAPTSASSSSEVPNSSEESPVEASKETLKETSNETAGRTSRETSGETTAAPLETTGNIPANFPQSQSDDRDPSKANDAHSSEKNGENEFKTDAIPSHPPMPPLVPPPPPNSARFIPPPQIPTCTVQCNCLISFLDISKRLKIEGKGMLVESTPQIGILDPILKILLGVLIANALHKSKTNFEMQIFIKNAMNALSRNKAFRNSRVVLENGLVTEVNFTLTNNPLMLFIDFLKMEFLPFKKPLPSFLSWKLTHFPPMPDYDCINSFSLSDLNCKDSGTENNSEIVRESGSHRTNYRDTLANPTSVKFLHIPKLIWPSIPSFGRGFRMGTVATTTNSMVKYRNQNLGNTLGNHSVLRRPAPVPNTMGHYTLPLRFIQISNVYLRMPLPILGLEPVKPHSTSTRESDRYGPVVQELDEETKPPSNP
ncbi:MAG: hypothetical protein LBT98_00565 [Puniceicoccales bacterium]|nr:hypothetical protein [Puniceicoccales bacterium]